METKATTNRVYLSYEYRIIENAMKIVIYAFELNKLDLLKLTIANMYHNTINIYIRYYEHNELSNSAGPMYNNTLTSLMLYVKY